MTNALDSTTLKYFYTKLLQNIAELNEFLDVTLSVNGKAIRAHRLILAAGSTYFLEEFKRCGLNHAPVFIFTNIRYDHLAKIILFLYTGTVDVPANEVQEFLSLAKQFKILGLDRLEDVDVLSISSQRSYVDSTDENDIPLDISSNPSDSNVTSTINKKNKTQQLSQQPNGSNDQANNKKRARSLSVPMNEINAPSTSKTAISDEIMTEKRVENAEITTRSKTQKPNPKNGMTNGNGKSSKEILDISTASVCSMSSESSTKRRKCYQAFHERGKTKQFHCPVCKRSFYFRHGLMNHFSKSSCKLPPDFNMDE